MQEVINRSVRTEANRLTSTYNYFSPKKITSSLAFSAKHWKARNYDSDLIVETIAATGMKQRSRLLFLQRLLQKKALCE